MSSSRDESPAHETLRLSAREYDRILRPAAQPQLEGSKKFAWFLKLKRILINSQMQVFGWQVFGYEPEALNVDVAGEIQYLLGGKGNDALEALHHTPAMRVIIYLAKPLGCAEETVTSFEKFGL